ncbi:MAG TPA: phosphonate ABC transporter substrate-binding protein, partial [Desulfobulbaceae bacterium]|nr:phosphonate ABC transporter substrate-binding protein [Desulfobulbaceae bacterium]
MKRTIVVLFSLVATLALMITESPAQQQWPEEITFGVIPVASSREMSDSFGNLSNYLQKELGIKVKLQVAGD